MVARLSASAVRSQAGGPLLAFLERFQGARPNLFHVLTYHRVADQAGFQQQMDYLASHYRVTAMAELLEAGAGRAVLPPRSILITFDDAYRNFADCAWPILKGLGLPVTLFVPTAFPDRPDQVFWWDTLQEALNNTARRDNLATPAGRLVLASAAGRRKAYKQLRRYVSALPHAEAPVWSRQLAAQLGVAPAESEVLGWDALRRLAAEGVTLGAHTRTHPLMDRISPPAAQAEALGSRRDLERETGQDLPIFAYPGGKMSDGVVQALREAGFGLAFTTVRGANDLRHTDPLRLRRVNIGPQATLAVLRARLLHSSVYLNGLRGEG